MQAGAKIIDSQVRYFKIEQRKTMGAIYQHLHPAVMGHVGYFAHRQYLPNPVYNMRKVQQPCFTGNSSSKGIYNLLIIFYRKVKRNLLVHYTIPIAPLPPGLYHIGVILQGAYYFIAGF